ncbi:hypothetical protein H04402_02341 [Clostridium botulinum H04402 065]|nr:hypothetical protein H04402_02341 [Clostridium botulinum H04402 065]
MVIKNNTFRKINKITEPILFFLFLLILHHPYNYIKIQIYLYNIKNTKI